MPKRSLSPCGGAALLLTTVLLTGCGGGGDDGDDGGDPPDGNNSRHASISYDLDNNGVADAQSTLRYDSAGRVAELRYVYTGDGTADRFDGRGQDSVTEAYAFDGQGRLASFTNTAAEGSSRFTFVYGSGAQPTRADVTAGGMTGQRNYSFSSAGLMTRVELVLQGQVLGDSSFDYDAQGRRTLATETTAGADAAASTRYTWNSDGTLAAVDRDIDADGTHVRYEMSYQNGLQTGTRKLVAGQLLYLVRFSYDTQNRLARAVFDMGGDGSDDASMTLTWETGACQSAVLPEFDPLTDAITGSGGSATGRISACAR